MLQVSLEDQLYRSLLTSLSLTSAPAKLPVSRRVIMDISTTKEKEKGLFDKVCIISTHDELEIFLNV